MNLHPEKSATMGVALYTFASNRYFESFERIAATGDYRNILRRHLPSAWTLKKTGLWYYACSPNIVLPMGGFKLHVSATVSDAKRLLAVVLPICVAENVNFKVLRASNLLALANSKSFPRANAHKFITIYPLTTDHFLSLANILDVKTRDFAGPYVLSDKPVNRSRVVFYRFGGFIPRTRVTMRGVKEQLIQTSDNTWIQDERLPYFRLPAGISDPFPIAATASTNEPIILNVRYQVERALSLSTRGGTYVAMDMETKAQVLIKEARPLTTLTHNPKWCFYASDALLREERILGKLAQLTCVPRHLGRFQEAGHTFSVQQMLSARPFRRYRARDDVMLAPFEAEEQAVERFSKAFREIAWNLIKAISAIHGRKIIIGDVSPDNVLVDEWRNVYLVDFESAWDRSWAPVADKLATVWMTPGFRRPHGRILKPVTYRDDWFAAGMLLFSMLLPVEPLSVVLPKAHDRFLEAIVRAAQLPSWIPETIRSLLAARPRVALTLLEENRRFTLMPSVQHHSAIDDIGETGRREAAPLMDRVKDAVKGIGNHLLDVYDPKRHDRLWPADFKVFSTNPLSVAYGACGPLLFLGESGVEIPDEVHRWLHRKPLTLSNYPPGLYLGLAGIAYTLWRLGHQDRAVDALSRALRSDLLYADWGIFLGAAGCGLASLQMYLWTQDEKFAKQAIEIGAHILKNSLVTGHGIAWRTASGETLPGFAHGGSGIALFLLYLSLVVRDDQYIVTAKKALEHEIASASVESQDHLPRWKANSKRNVWSPYWLYGGCGIGSVFIRFYRALKEERYLQIARDIAHANYSRFAVLPGQFEGLSGIGDFMLDMSMLGGDEEFDIKARNILESILLYGVARSGATAFPGRFLLRLSTDYGYGSSGVGIFLSRFSSGTGRLLHDLAGM